MKTLPKNDGFTLIELLTTIAIIGLLSTLAMVAVGVAKEKAKVSNAQHDIDQIFKAITLMQNDTGEWPGHQVMNQACAALPGGCPADNEICGADKNANDCANGLGDPYSGLTADYSVPYKNWAGPYLKQSLINDPWGHEYFFDTDYSVNNADEPCACSNIGCHDVAVVGSYGPDGEGKPDTGVAGAYGCDDIILIVGR